MLYIRPCSKTNEEPSSSIISNCLASNNQPVFSDDSAHPRPLNMRQISSTLMAILVMAVASQVSVIPRTEIVEIVFPWLLPETVCDSGSANRKVVYTMTNVVPLSP